jgi:hypothetical protein
MYPRVLVSIVTYNSALYLKACLESLRAQTCSEYAIVLWDNASTDNTPAIIEHYRPHIRFVHHSQSNVGFCAAHNRLIDALESDYVLVLNPDVIHEPRFMEILLREMDLDSGAGAATGKLLRQPETASPPRRSSDKKILDTTGIYMTPNQRHFDRGSGESDIGLYNDRQYVFGASGAAAFYRRKMLEDIRDGNEYFDESSLHTGKMWTWHGGLNGWDGVVCTYRKRRATTPGRSCPKTGRPCPRRSICIPLKTGFCCASKTWTAALTRGSSFRLRCGTLGSWPMSWCGNGLPFQAFFSLSEHFPVPGLSANPYKGAGAFRRAKSAPGSRGILLRNLSWSAVGRRPSAVLHPDKTAHRIILAMALRPNRN